MSVLLLNLVSAGAAAIIGMKGLEVLNPGAAAAVNQIICLTEPLSCAAGFVVGQVQSEVISTLAKESPETAKMIIAYNQIKGGINDGAEILEEFEMDSNGEITTGKMLFGDEKVSNIGNLIGSGIKAEDISVKGVELSKRGETTTIAFSKEESIVNIKGNKFENIVSQDKAGLPTFIELDSNGGINEARFTVNENGGDYVFGNTIVNAPPNSKVSFNKYTGINIKVEDGGQITNLPMIKDGLQNSGNYETVMEGKEFTLPNGARVSGKIIQRGEETFVNLDDGTKIEEVEFFKDQNNLQYTGEIQIFFDGEKRGGNSASFDLENKKILLNSENGNFISRFNEGNSFMKVDKGDFAAIQNFPNSEIEIQNRDNEGLIPRVSTEGDFVIYEDGKKIENSNGKINIHDEGYKKTTTTSPIEIFVLGDDNILGERNTIIVDNFNRIAIGQRDDDEISINEGNINIKISKRVKYNYPTKENIEVLTGKEIVFEDVSEGSEYLALGRLRDYLDNTPNEIKNVVAGIKFKGGIGAHARPDGNIIFGVDKTARGMENYDFDYETLRHEFAHALQLKQIDKEKGDKFLEYLYNKQDGFSTGSGLLNAFDKINRDIAESLAETTPFEKEWAESGGYNFIDEPIPENIVNIKTIMIITKEYTDGSLKNGGFVNEYGKTNIYEDVATFTGKVAANPSFFKGHIDPKSPDYNPIYRKKLDLLNKYKFISEQEYNKVLEEAGVKWKKKLFF